MKIEKCKQSGITQFNYTVYKYTHFYIIVQLKCNKYSYGQLTVYIHMTTIWCNYAITILVHLDFHVLTSMSRFVLEFFIRCQNGSVLIDTCSIILIIAKYQFIRQLCSISIPLSTHIYEKTRTVANTKQNIVYYVRSILRMGGKKNC